MNFKLKYNYFWMIVSYIVFLVLYNSSNFYASRLDFVPSFYLSWEKHIPFIPFMIIPYLSSGAFFALVFFMCEKREEASLLAKRMNFITIISVTVFFIWPLSFSFQKPPVSNNFYNFLFECLQDFDRNYNQFPSLHISYCFIYLSVFRAKTVGFIRFLISFWLLLLAASTLTVYQHHYIDIIGGTFIAILAFILFPSKERKWNVSVSLVYYTLSFILFSAATLFNGLFLILLYPALSCFLVGNAYKENNPDFIRKRGGRIPFFSWILYAPYLLCYEVILRFFNKNKEPFAEIISGLYTGKRLSSVDAVEVITEDTAVIDLAAEVAENRLCCRYDYYYFPVLDISPPDPNIYGEALNTIEKLLKSGKKVYVHCTMGYSRSLMLVISYLIKYRGMEKSDAISMVRQKRPELVLKKYMNELF